jgi:hypothetical protein
MTSYGRKDYITPPLKGKQLGISSISGQLSASAWSLTADCW